MSIDQFYIKPWELIKVYIKAHRKLFRGFKILFTSSIGTQAELRGERGRELTPSPTSVGAELARLWCPGTSIRHFENMAVFSVGTLSSWTWIFMFSGCHILTPSSFHTILLSLTDAEGHVSISVINTGGHIYLQNDLSFIHLLIGYWTRIYHPHSIREGKMNTI